MNVENLNVRGTDVPVRVHTPLESKSDGAVILIPGKGYHKNMPMMRRSADALSLGGITSVRFDWGFMRAGGKPSANLDAEVADLNAVIDAVAELGSRRYVLAAKSFGCIVAARVATSRPIAGLVWLTPPLHPRNDGARPFPGSEHLSRVEQPLMIVAGDRDPMCHLDRLAAFVARCPASTRLVIVPGDNTLDAETQAEADASLKTMVDWLRTWSDQIFHA